MISGISESDPRNIDAGNFDVKSSIVDSLFGHYRYRRQTSTYYIDILPIVDYSTYSLWFSRIKDENEVKTRLNTYLANTLTAVDMRLQTLQLDGTTLRVKMATPIISTDPSASPYTEKIKVEVQNETRVSAPTLLRTFADWLEAQSNLPPHDHAMLFTSYDLVPSENPEEILTAITKGLANVGVMCKNGSVSLIEDKGAYQSENVAAHELGHG
ncbi:A disintegrin and metalloproteinase with thrombospondin motifs 1 [Elysia marginata]|uniref:A disintegrin and metalloproteinase with thrombospondin motifs 1 n=1 Tax=Elysia marginata TaxID=1093978 RepID=A0AAV4F2Z1_9GAST|nr:A disintegrin and metalloproteinase with thrombospondin motifs 1 [Elysia marginata]